MEQVDEPQTPYDNCQSCLHWVHDGYWYCECNECRYEPKDEPQANCGDFADRLAYERGVKHAWEVAQKVFNSTVTFYEAEDVAKQIDKDINVRSKDEPQIGEMMTEEEFDSMLARVLTSKDEPQTERSE